MGAIINKEIAKTMANAVEKKSANLLGSSSSGIAISTEYCKVAIPIFMASNKDAIPLKIGLFQRFDFSVMDVNSFFWI